MDIDPHEVAAVMKKLHNLLHRVESSNDYVKVLALGTLFQLQLETMTDHDQGVVKAAVNDLAQHMIQRGILGQGN